MYVVDAPGGRCAEIALTVQVVLIGRNDCFVRGCDVLCEFRGCSVGPAESGWYLYLKVGKLAVDWLLPVCRDMFPVVLGNWSVGASCGGGCLILVLANSWFCFGCAHWLILI